MKSSVGCVGAGKQQPFRFVSRPAVGWTTSIPSAQSAAGGGGGAEQRAFAALLGAGGFIVILVRRERHGALGAGVAVSAVVHDFKLVDVVDVARWFGNVLHCLQVNRVLAKTRRVVLVTTGATRRAHAWWRRLRGVAGNVSIGASSCA